MTFRTRLLITFGVTVAAVAGLVSAAISVATIAAFERLGDQQTRILAAQFQREFDWRSREVTRRLDAILATEQLRHLTTELARPGFDGAPFVDLAAQLAREHALDFLDILDANSGIVSSAHYPARFGYHKEWVLEPAGWKERDAFVNIEEIPDGVATALLAVRGLNMGGSTLYLVGGRRLDRDFLDSIPLPPGIRAELRLRPVSQGGGSDDLPGELMASIPLRSRQADMPASLVLSGGRPELAQLRAFLRWLGIGGAVLGVVTGLIVAWVVSRHVTRPVQSLAEGAREVAAGNWNQRVHIASHDELGELGNAFNRMTAQLAEQRDRLLQVERVAAWRELARRLAHELKNPLFPLQITVENLQRARREHPEQFEEVFRESTTTLLVELANLKQIVARFSDFARMPAAQFETLDIREFLDSQVRLFDAQWRAPGRPFIEAKVVVDEQKLGVPADPELLGRAVRNLVLNAMDAMPQGGSIGLHAFRRNGQVILEVSDTGAGLTPEECERLFTPYYTTKHYGTGLGLAIVQSVVSDHGGRISVASTPGLGTTFSIELPAARNPDGTPASY